MENNDLKNKGTSLLGEFKEFIAKGNVIDLAVGLIIGSAFTAIVTSLVEDIFTPLLGMVLAGINFNNLGVEIPWGNHPFINFGAFFQAVITFLLTAVVVFLLVKLISVFRKKKEEAPKGPSAEEKLLTEIRDLLKEQNNK